MNLSSSSPVDASARHEERLAKTATQDAIIVEATARRVIGPRRGITLVVLPILVVLALLGAVRASSRVERELAEDARRSVRLVVYQLDRDHEVRVPIEPGTEVLRIVAHLVRRGPITPGPHEVRLSVAIRGEQGSHAEDITLFAPPATGRATAEEPGDVVGDPVGVDVDTQGFGVGQMTISLREIDEADGLLLRVARREAVSPLDAVHRLGDLDEERRKHLARRAGRLNWADLPDTEQEVLIGARWRKVAAVSDAALVTRTIALAPPSTPAPSEDTSPVTQLDLRTDERATLVASGPVRLVARAVAKSGAPASVTFRSDDGAVGPVSGEGDVTLEIPAGRTVGVEMATSQAGALAVRSSDPTRLELPPLTRLFRATPERALIVTAGTRSLVLRVMARLPMPRAGAEAAEISLLVAVDERGRRGNPTRYPLTARVVRSRFDRYDDAMPDTAPSERAPFHVLVPAGGKVTLAPTHGAVDLSVAELDTRAVRPVAAIPINSPPSVPSAASAPAWEGFVPRLPSNEKSFDREGTVFVRLADRFASPSPPLVSATLLRFQRPAGPEMPRGNRVFTSAKKALTIDLKGGGPSLVTVSLYAAERTTVVARIDGSEPLRRTKGTAAKITTPRQIVVEGEVRAFVLLGDDLKPGIHTLTFETDDGRTVWVHVPWVREAIDPHWVSGDFSEP